MSFKKGEVVIYNNEARIVEKVEKRTGNAVNLLTAYEMAYLWILIKNRNNTHKWMCLPKTHSSVSWCRCRYARRFIS